MTKDENHEGLVEDLPLEEVDMEASDRALDAGTPELIAEMRALGINVDPPTGDQSTRGTDDSKV